MRGPVQKVLAETIKERLEGTTYDPLKSAQIAKVGSSQHHRMLVAVCDMVPFVTFIEPQGAHVASFKPTTSTRTGLALRLRNPSLCYDLLCHAHAPLYQKVLKLSFSAV